MAKENATKRLGRAGPLFNPSRVALACLLPVLAGCSFGAAPRVDIHVIGACAKQHPPPPEGNVERIGLLPAYLGHSADSNDAAMQKWYADMDSCTAQPAAAGK